MGTAWRRRVAAALAAAALSCGPAWAATFRAVVTHVTDGDTLWVHRTGQRHDVELRLLDLDAPEGCQRHGAVAKKALQQRLLHQTVVVRTTGVDDYQRSLARVRHRGEDVGAWLVREGHAWSSARGRAGPYETVERQARRARRGLWAHPDAEEPRAFRRSHGRCK